MQIISVTCSSSSSSSSSSSAHSSGDHYHPAKKGMRRFKHLHHRHSPSHPKAKKHHHHRHHPCHSPLPFDHRLAHHFDHHRHERAFQLRVKPPKAPKKIRKLHYKLLKACKLSKGARHSRPHMHIHGFLPEKRFLCTRIGELLSPGNCCLHGVEEGSFASEEQCIFHEIGVHHHKPRHRAHSHPSGPHRLCQRSECIKSEAMGGPISGMEEPLAEPPIEGGELLAE